MATVWDWIGYLKRRRVYPVFISFISVHVHACTHMCLCVCVCVHVWRLENNLQESVLSPNHVVLGIELTVPGEADQKRLNLMSQKMF